MPGRFKATAGARPKSGIGQRHPFHSLTTLVALNTIVQLQHARGCRPGLDSLEIGHVAW
jgi:hypothetical protein